MIMAIRLVVTSYSMYLTEPQLLPYHTERKIVLLRHKDVQLYSI